MKQRIIFHVDMDAFFASIEIACNPALRGKAVIVGGDSLRGVVSTCSYEARAFGVRSAMSLAEAHQKCPHAIFLTGNYSLYREYSEKVMAIFRQVTEKVQVVSVDEAYIDVTDKVNTRKDAFALAQLIHQTVYQQTSLTCSIGIASNKLVAKMASSAAKPNSIKEVVFGQEASFLAPLPIGSIPGVGKKTEETLKRSNIWYIQDLQAMGLDAILQLYGPWGYQIYLSAIGQDTRPVEWTDHPAKSIGAETTFEKDQTDKAFLFIELEELVEKACRHLHASKMRTCSICLKLRDNNFKTITRHRQLFGDTQDKKTIHAACRLFFDEMYSGSPPLRLIGISLQKLTDEYWQPTLWQWDCN